LTFLPGRSLRKPDNMVYWRDMDFDPDKATLSELTAFVKAAGRKAGRRSYRERDYRNKYGLSLDDYDRMFESQNEGCAICGGSNPNGKRLFVDHNHKTGAVRGLLCSNCNSALGMLKDSPELCRRAATYLG